MKKLIIFIISLIMLVSNVYAKELWFVLTPCVDSEGEKADEKYENSNVEVDFKIIEIIDKIIT